MRVRDMKIKLSGLGDGEHRYSFDNLCSELGLGDEYVKKVIVDVMLRKSIRQYYLNIDCSTEKKSVCDRCLSDFYMKLNCSFKLVYTYDQSFSDPNYDEVKFLMFHDTEIEIDDDVRQMLILSVPMKSLCNYECKGLCISCGVNLNNSNCNCETEISDSKFIELKKLKF
jgi:uncharacterized protein